MRAMKKTIITIYLIICSTATAWTCDYVDRPFEENYERAETVFIGKVVRHEEGKFVLAVYKAIKGIEDAQEFKVPDTMRTDCDIGFHLGQVWLFLGERHPDGSMLLVDEKGNAIEPAVQFVSEKFQFKIVR